MVRHSRRLFVLVAVLLLTACPGPRRPEPAVELPPPPALKPVPGAKLYEVDPKQSLVRILVYRGGTLASAGHNHVIASHEVTGRVYLHENLSKSAFELNMPVGTLTVDEAQLRAAEGQEGKDIDFPPAVPESAKQGTKNNMLGAALLDSEHFPVVRLVSVAIEGTPARPLAQVTVGVRNHWSELSVPLSLKRGDHFLTATGTFTVRQTALGLEPFSVMMGALKVQDELTVKFSVFATSSSALP